MNKVIKVCLLALTLTPLIVDKSVFAPYVSGESIFIRGVLVIVSILFSINFFYKKEFKNEIIEKIKKIIKNPLFLSISAFIFVAGISTIFAVDKYGAFWGNLERAEGLVGLISFFAFFIFSLLIFEKKDWLSFFKLILIVTLALVVKEFVQYAGGLERPNSFVYNPTFLAGYLLFSIFSSVIVFKESIQSKGFIEKGWMYLSIITIILSIIGIFLTQTRGSILGLAVGVIAVLVYGVLKGRGISYNKFNLRKISIIILCCIFAFGALFVFTRKSELWQKVPGLARVAVISSEDATTNTRLLTAKLSLDAINPLKNSLKKSLIGWGPENFTLAYQKYLNPLQFKYETRWFDRAHNKIFDVLVMSGILGLVAYLTLWFYFFKLVLKRKEFSLINVGLLFVGISFLVHLLFIFDHITTYIPFFATLAFTVYLATSDKSDELKDNNQYNNKIKIISGILFCTLTVFLCFVFFRGDLPAYIDMKEYLALKKANNPELMLSRVDKIFTPFTIAQANIRNDFLVTYGSNTDMKDTTLVKLNEIATTKEEEFVNKRPFDSRSLVYIANVYSGKGKELKDQSFLEKGEGYFRKVVALAPNRPDSNYGLALNLYYQMKFSESFVFFERALDLDSAFFSKEIKRINGIYFSFIQYFYELKDKDNFIKATARLKANNYEGGAILDQIIEFINKNNTWPVVNFK